MPVTTVFLLRHGHRLSWTLDPSTGKYTSTHPFPTRLPADPPLASHGVRQAHETAAYLSPILAESCQKDTLRIYSSLFYRCLETLRPTVEKLRASGETEEEKAVFHSLKVRGERGVGEWFGRAWFEQPVPGDKEWLRDRFFGWVDGEYESMVIPERHGEIIDQLHDRVAKALSLVVKNVDVEFEALGRGEEEVTILICGHAAPIIASGRALTGIVPEDLNEKDFKCFTCGLSKFTRRKRTTERQKRYGGTDDKDWKTNGGVAGGWDCVVNSGCEHLSQGEERGWHFHGDESFDSYGPGSAKGPITSDGGVKKQKVEDTNEALANGAKL